MSDFFQPTRGLFQGNPVASVCFVILIELLATMLRSHKGIHGIKMGEIELLLSQFADDLCLFLNFNQKI